MLKYFFMTKFIFLLLSILLIRLALFILNPPPVSFAKDPIRETKIFTSIKGHIETTYLKYLPAKDAKLLMGIVFGSKDLDHDSIKKFQSTGVLHIIAASGMNVSMLTAFVLGLLVLFLKRPYALVATAAVVIFYTALADFQPSIVRAAIMALFALGAGVAGRQNTSLLALFFAAWAMIFADPAILVSISFILSFSATLGMVLIDPLLKKTYFSSSVWEDFRATLAAQIATTPILLFFFGTYSITSIFTNLLVLWTVPPLMVLGMISSLLSFVLDIFAAPFIFLSLPLLSYFWAIIDLFAKVADPAKIENIPWTIVVGYYLLLAAGIVFLNQKLVNRK